jgi:hypothetical protein
MTRPPVQQQSGYALVTAMIFLIILTLVALIAIRTTGLEIKMGANNAMRIEALEASETPRTALGPLLDAHVFARGWPESAGGDVVDSLFAYTIPTQMTIAEDSSSAPRTWYAANSEVEADEDYVFDPLHLDTDVTYSRNAAASGAPAYQITGKLSVFKLRTDIAAGSGAAMVSGYEGVGKAAAAAGGNVFFYIQSEGRDPGTEARYVTGAVYRHVITN